MGIENGQDPAVLQRAARILAEGGLVAFATETVYGLGARADDEAAVARVFALKGRPADHPLIVHVADAEAARNFAEHLSEAAQRLMQQLWPGPVSLVVRRKPGVATAAAAGLPTLALRCPSHPVARALLRCAAAWGVAGIAAPSANRFGRVSPTRAEHVLDEFGAQLMILDGGPCSAGIESAIVDCSDESPRLLRPGSLSRARIEEVLGRALGERAASSPRVSGALPSHYAPNAELQLVPTAQLAAVVAQLQSRLGELAVGVLARSWPAGTPRPPVFRPMPDNAESAAHELFDALRRLDAQGLRVICVEAPPDDPAWEGVRDRLQRASAAR